MKNISGISFALFIIVSLATQKKYPGKERHDVNDYVLLDVLSIFKHFKNRNELIQKERIKWI